MDLPSGANRGAKIIRSRSRVRTSESPSPIGDTVSGQALYAKRCAPCHGPEGLGGVGLALKPNEFIQGLKNAEMIEFLKVGRPGTAMASFKGRLTDAELADIVTFLRTWQP